VAEWDYIPPTQREIDENRRALELAGDIAFQSDVRYQMGPYGSRAIGNANSDWVPNRTMLSGPRESRIRGMHVPEGSLGSAGNTNLRTFEEVSPIAARQLRVGGREDWNAPEPGVTTFGTRGMDPKVWAHEFRHSELSMENISNEEQTNRWLDAWRASNPQQWADAVLTLKEMLAAGEEMNGLEFSDYVDARLEDRKESLIKIEADYMREHELAYPNTGTAEEHLDQQYNTRRRSRRSALNNASSNR